MSPLFFNMTAESRHTIDPEANARELDQLLTEIDAATLTERDKGTRFETLIRDWLTKEPTYSDCFTQVQTYKDWANEHLDLVHDARDIGVDLVGTNSDDGEYTAIQCKFYSRNARVAKKEVDSFLAASGTPFFTKRFLVATNQTWTENLEKELQGQKVPVTLITRAQLAASTVNWGSYRRTGIVELQKKRIPRDYQKEAIANVIKGFATHDCGKLIMACGTGKTFTSMKIAEEMEGKGGGLVMFLVPSLALLSQTLSDWKQQCNVPIHVFAVCSDTTTGKVDNEDASSLTVSSELNYPATTDAEKLAEEVKAVRAKPGMTVIFSTYQSIEVVSQAQHRYGLGDIGLIICDEAHRTSGGHFADDADAPFQRIHENSFIRGKKRLYMTATPRIFGDAAKKQQAAGDVVLYSMDDENIFGPTFHTITFSDAVLRGCLVDYKVIVLTVDESVLHRNALSDREVMERGGLSVKNAAKVIGCWRALSKMDLQAEPSVSDDRQPMRRAVGFAQVIRPDLQYADKTASLAFTQNFQSTIEEYKTENFAELLRKDPQLTREAYDAQFPLSCSCRHIDGSMNATEKGELLSWLRETPPDHVCKILFNVRCLSEGVDVPSLDAVIFLSPRKSQVDVVQTVGRVMRKAPGKQRGYVILPIVTPAGLDPASTINNCTDFEVVWQVLNALKSINPEFGSIVDGQLQKVDPNKIEVVCISTDSVKHKPKTKGDPQTSGNRRRKKLTPEEKEQELHASGSLFQHDEILEEEIRSRIVKRVGNRREWGDWAESVGEICRLQVHHIKKVLADPTHKDAIKTFGKFRKEIQATLNGDMSDDEIIDMLAQHVVTKPLLDALFTVRDEKGQIVYSFSERNPIARAMTQMVDSLDKTGMSVATSSLKDFYESVKLRTRLIKTAADRQILIKELFEKFFKVAFPKQQDKLGIVYTPIEIVDFINQSVADILKKEFHTDIAEKGVHILDPFTGTGTFVVRMMQKGLIPPDKLPYKFDHDLHANEIVPLAYYVASMNLEGVFHEICPQAPYAPNKVLVWTDTFAKNSMQDLFVTSLGENKKRVEALNETDIRVIIGNPPYSVGQASQNDDNQNEHYEKLDARIAQTYAANTNSTLKGKLYDSYIRAYRWASDRIKERGVIGFVTNAGWIDSASADGMRKCLAAEFSAIYVYHLKGNQRTSGERSRQEGGKVFGAGSRAPVAIVILVKNPDVAEKGKIYIHEVDDYLSREEKLEQVRQAGSVLNLPMREIVPDSHGDWLNVREESFSKFMPMGAKATDENCIFCNYSCGLVTARDAWAYNSSAKKVYDSMRRSINFYNGQVEAISQHQLVEPNLDPKSMKWAVPQKEGVFQGKKSKPVRWEAIRVAQYRPFIKQHLYFDRFWNSRVSRMSKLFPANNGRNTGQKASNLVIAVSQNVKDNSVPTLMCSSLIDIQLLFNGQCFPRWIYAEEPEDSPQGDIFKEHYDQAASKYEGKSAIDEEALKHFQVAYPGSSLTADDLFFYVYGILHSIEYRKKYANNLMKELPRIPRVATYEQFKAFSDAGRKLADLHVNYEKVKPYDGVKFSEKRDDPHFTYRVEQMKWRRIPGKKGNAAKDKTTLIYNDYITVENIPLAAQEYVVNKKSALDWVVERACVKTDKDSGIVNDFNDYAEEMGNERYPLDLFLRVITVSLETMEIVKNLPQLEIHPLDR